MKFLKRHKNLINDIWTNKPVFIQTKKKKSRRLTLRDIFEEVSPGSYLSYGRLFSGLHHGGVGGLMFRTRRESNSIKEINMGSNWDEKNATFVVNNTIMLAYAFINNFPTFFPKGFKGIDQEVIDLYHEAIDWLRLALRDHKKTHPKSKNWYKEVAGLLRK